MIIVVYSYKNKKLEYQILQIPRIMFFIILI